MCCAHGRGADRPYEYSMLRNPSRGFSLVELMVAVGLFATVMTLATGAYLLMISVNRETQAVTTGINNLSYAVEFMSRNIMTGRTYRCGGATSGSSNTFSFKDAAGQDVGYQLSGGAIQESINNGTWATITEPGVVVDGLTFTCEGGGSRSQDAIQANVRINAYGHVIAGSGSGKQRDFALQTLVTMRNPDL